MAVVAALTGCPPPDECETKNNLLINTTATTAGGPGWAMVQPGDDPFAADKTKLLEPNGDGQYPPDDPGGDTPHNDRVCQMPADVFSEVLDEDTSLTVNTNVCGWATISEPLSDDFAIGQSMFARLFYFQQIAPGIADAHVLVTVAGQTVFQKTLPLPQPSTLIAEDFKSPVAGKKGDPLLWHIDNHGVNTWNILELSKTTPVACPTD
jgi:hypothetical protein